jgi:hypothetical protein
MLRADNLYLPRELPTGKQWQEREAFVQKGLSSSVKELTQRLEKLGKQRWRSRLYLRMALQQQQRNEALVAAFFYEEWDRCNV